MRSTSTDAVGVLGWGMRRYGALFLACFLLGGIVVPYLVLRYETPAEARALVLAQRLDMDLEALPRYGEAVFANGEVARAVASQFPDAGGEEDLIPERLYVLAEQDSLVLTVVGRDTDPQTAADIANVAAESYVQALNSAGPGVGLFILQSPAEPPSSGGENPFGMTVAIALGIAAGLALALAAVSVVLVARRPVVDAADAEQLTGIPVLGTVGVPRAGRDSYAPAEDFPGLVPVCRRLLSLGTSTIVVVSNPRERRVREQLSMAMAAVLMRVRNVDFVAPAPARAALAERLPAVAAGRRATGDPDRGSITLVDSSEPLDLVHPPEDTATVLVAPVGIRSTVLRNAVVEHLGGAVARIVLVKPAGRFRRRLGVAGDAARGRAARSAEPAERAEPVAGR